MTKEEGKLIVERLVNDFEQNERHYMSKDFQETEVRNRFIDPFFSALGWDFHQTNMAKIEWDVHREFSQRDNSSTKKPDYAFRAKDGNKYKVKFFVEAKAPWVKLTDCDPVYQAKRYAFSSHGKTPIVILTDFQEFRVFNGFQKPIYENPLQGLIAGLDIKYKDYIVNWDKIWSLFSKEAVINGSISSLAGTVSKNTKTLDQEFLEDISNWRETLAKHIALRNRDLKVEELNEAVQRIIDRLVFIRNLEDRGIESEGSLFSHTNIKEKIYQHLIPFFRNLDADYNGLLFKKHFSEDLVIDDKVIKDQIKQMCYPLSPYQFDEIEPEILGRIYEKFLGSKIRLTDGHSAKIEEKIEVRHAGGVYYTPQYIVDYIVKNTVGKKIEGKNPEEISKLSVCDPACGSGSFLLGAFEYIMTYHKNWYANEKQSIQKKHNSDFYFTAENEVKLTLKKRSEILKNNIFGVDIDREATEVTIMSLYLKLLDEGFDKGQVEMFMKGHILPDMTQNIKCGNSLIDQDFSMHLEERIDQNVFSWEFEFKNNGKFDVVIGNPPYVNLENIPEIHKKYYVQKYGENGKLGKRYDLYQIFIMKGMQLLKEKSSFGYIIPNTFLMGKSYLLLRKKMSIQTKIEQIVDLPQGVFQGVTVDNVLLFLERTDNSIEIEKSTINVNKLMEKSEKTRVTECDWDETFRIPQSMLTDENEYQINLHKNPKVKMIFEKIETDSIPLGDITESTQGIILYKTEEDAIKNRYTSFEERPGWKKLLRGKNIGRYETKWAGEYVSYGDWLWCQRDEKYFTSPKILLHAMRNKSLKRRLVGTYDSENYYNAHNLANIIIREDTPYSLLYILAIFNSDLANYWYKSHFPNVNINPNDFRKIPIKKIDFSKPAQKKIHDSLSQNAEQMIELNFKKKIIKSESEINQIERQLNSIDRTINEIIFDLYCLNQDEINVIMEN